MSAHGTPRRGAGALPSRAGTRHGRAASASRFGRNWRAAILAVAAVVLVVGVWPVLRPEAAVGPGSGGLPGPFGGPDVAQDVDTLVGRPARTFVLSDSEGKSYTVSPGGGKPLVLIFHMGLL